MNNPTRSVSPFPIIGLKLRAGQRGVIGLLLAGCSQHRGQRAWARQFNPESHTESEVINEGADVWILGLKTEYATTMVVNRDGGSLEVLGGFLYPVTAVPPGMPGFG